MDDPKTRREQKKTKKDKKQHQGPYSSKHIRQQEAKVTYFRDRCLTEKVSKQ